MYWGLARSSLVTLTLLYPTTDFIIRPRPIPHIVDILRQILPTPPIVLLAGLVGHYGPIPHSDHAHIPPVCLKSTLVDALTLARGGPY